MTIPPTLDACLDRPSPLDYRASKMGQLVGSTAKRPSFPEALLAIFNQGTDPETLMSCTRQGLGNITNGNNLLAQGEQDILLGKREWLRAMALAPNIKADGDYLQNALNQYKSDGLIAGYYVVSGKQEHMDAIDKGHFIYSGSNNGDWRAVRDTKTYGLKSPSSGHAFVKGCSYNEQGMRGINSYGNENGFFTIPWELCDTTFTSYAIIDFVDEAAILAYKKKKDMDEIEEAVALGIFNGKDLDAPLTRRDGAKMVLRAYKLSKGV